jgi:hypothetical protein
MDSGLAASRRSGMTMMLHARVTTDRNVARRHHPLMQILFSTGADEFYFFTAHLFQVPEIAASALLSRNLSLLA